MLARRPAEPTRFNSHSHSSRISLVVIPPQCAYCATFELLIPSRMWVVLIPTPRIDV